MKTFNIHCEDPWFSFIRQGIKTVEGRKGTHLYKNIQSGDQIHFTNGTESFKAEVSEVRRYDSLEQYFEDATLERALPGVKSLEEGLAIYHQWCTKEQIERYGFLGISLKPIHQ